VRLVCDCLVHAIYVQIIDVYHFTSLIPSRRKNLPGDFSIAPPKYLMGTVLAEEAAAFDVKGRITDFAAATAR
jgi:hypothetical protein